MRSHPHTDDLNEILAQAHAMRAEALRAGFARLWSAITHPRRALTAQH